MRYAQTLNGLLCIVCSEPLKGRQTKFCSRTCKHKVHNSVVPQRDRRLTRRLRLVELAGGCCSICGYRKNLAALSFHHLDATKKDFKLDVTSLGRRTIESILTELSKCILVCQNCHAEIHSPHLDLDTLLQAGRSDH